MADSRRTPDLTLPVGPFTPWHPFLSGVRARVKKANADSSNPGTPTPRPEGPAATCKVCTKKLSGRRRSYCSDECQRVAARGGRPVLRVFRCQHCGEHFQSTAHSISYCGDYCRRRVANLRKQARRYRKIREGTDGKPD